MNACRSVWGVTALPIPARRAVRRTIRPASCRSSRRPSAARNTVPSHHPGNDHPRARRCLVVPHIVRLMVGSDHRRVLPVGVLFGASFMVLGDLLARVIVAPQEMPIGVITAFIGAPALIILIRRRPYLYGATG
jgi:hypothetical protein